MQNGTHKSTWVHIRFGRRHNDDTIAVNYENKRMVVKHNTEFIQGGVFLEEIPHDVRGHKTGMVLLQSGWSKLYLVRERPHWIDERGQPAYDDYFSLAERLMSEKGINPNDVP